MPLHESLPIKVTLIVEVDGHTLTFIETSKATGARRHGEDPDPFKLGFTMNDVLESTIRGGFDACIGRCATRAVQLLQRAYPIYSDREDSK